MADQDQTATEATEVPTEVTDTDLAKVTGGSAFIKPVQIEGESTHQDHKG